MLNVGASVRFGKLIRNPEEEKNLLGDIAAGNLERSLGRLTRRPPKYDVNPESPTYLEPIGEDLNIVEKLEAQGLDIYIKAARADVNNNGNEYPVVDVSLARHEQPLPYTTYRIGHFTEWALGIAMNHALNEEMSHMNAEMERIKFDLLKSKTQ